jgi:hypothetical protein
VEDRQFDLVAKVCSRLEIEYLPDCCLPDCELVPDCICTGWVFCTRLLSQIVCPHSPDCLLRKMITSNNVVYQMPIQYKFLPDRPQSGIISFSVYEPTKSGKVAFVQSLVALYCFLQLLFWFNLRNEKSNLQEFWSFTSNFRS